MAQQWIQRLLGRQRVTAVIIAVVATIALSGPAEAAEFRSGESPRVGPAETVRDDVYLFGGTAEIAGTVDGDAIISAGDVSVPGQVTGSLTVAAGTVDIAGTIGRSVRATAGEITIRGRVAGDLVVLAGSVTITNTATIGGDVILGGGTARIRGQVGGDVRGSAGELDIASRIGGDVRVEADTIRLRSGARIGGDFRYTSRKAAQIDDGVTITGATQRTEPRRFYPGDNAAAWLGSAIFRLLCALVAGAALVILMPGTTAAIADAIRQAPLWSFLTGLVLAVLVPVLVVVLLITIVGIPLALIVMALYLIILYLSQVFLGLALGRILLPSGWDTASRGYNLLAMTIGVLIVAGLRLLPVPFISGAIAAVTAVLGLGAVVIGLRRARRASPIPASRF